MGFLAPLGLAALAAIAIPILLHLRAAAPPERVQVGSIADLTAGMATQSRPRLREFLLLALRILFVAILALLLARPTTPDRRAGRIVAVIPEGASEISDSLRQAGVPSITVTPASRDPWSVAQRAEQQLALRDTILVVTPDGGDRYPAIRPVLAHTVRGLASRDSTAPPLAPLRVHIAASDPRYVPQRDSVDQMLRRLPATLLEITDAAGPGVRLITVGGDSALGLDARFLAAGAISRTGALDSLWTRLRPPMPAAPPMAQRTPRQIADDRSTDPSRDLRALCWWSLLALLIVERIVASRRV